MQYSYLITLFATTVLAGPIGLRSPNPQSNNSPSSTDPFLNALSNGPISDEPPTVSPKDQCHFSLPGHHPALSTPPIDPQAVILNGPISDKPTSSASIPNTAWPHISSILEKITTDKQNTMQTWDLGRAFSDNTLEGIMVGIVYSATDVPAAAGSAPGARIKIKSRDERSAVVKEEGKGDVDMSELESGKKWRRECVEGAVKEVEGRQQMEGVMDLAEDVTGSGGRISFLVYRVD